MSIFNIKRLVTVLGVLCVMLFVGIGFLLWSYGWLQVQVLFADDQTQIFDEMRTKAIQSASPTDIAGALEYVADYYPSGSKQRVGTRLDRVVERHRAAIAHDIIAHLRGTTGQDVGTNPKRWIEKYAQGSDRPLRSPE